VYTADRANIALTGDGALRITPTLDGGVWHSARIETNRSDFAPPSGGSLKIEARIQLPAGGQGYWPAFWALGNTFRTKQQQWPHTGEIDVMENVNNAPTIHGTFHCGSPSGGPCNGAVGLDHRYALPAPAGSTGYHTYTVIWQTAPQQLTWQVDGQTYATLTPAETGQQAWDAALNHGYFLLLNLAIGGHWPGLPNKATRAGASMLIDYVSVAERS
jgi:beta-glucanase (GH16 family)